jgi:DNA-binding NarL/FixJ family response regulator
MPKTVLLVDDHQTVRKVICDFFETLEDWEISGEAANGPQAIQKAMELKPDLILMDLSMPRLNGIETASVLKNMLPGVRIILFTMFDCELGSRLSSAVGVELVVPKSEGLTGLVKALNHLMVTTQLEDGHAQASREETRAAKLP